MIKQNLKTVTLGALAALFGVLAGLGGTNVSAWGPDRPTYTMAAPADHATFNSITDNKAVGDERDFVRIAEKGSGVAYSSDIEIEPNKQYEVYIYYHNNASSTYNTKAAGYAGVARDVRLSTNFPDTLAAGERGKVDGKITATNTDPAAVWDEAYITAKEAVTLHYVDGSAKIYNDWGVNGSVLSTSLFSDTGTFLGLNSLNGVILGCDEFSGQVVYTIRTLAVEGTPTMPTDPEPTPMMPKELPTTGPIEVALVVVLLLAMLLGVIYWTKTHRDINKITKKSKKAKGKK